MLYITTDEIQNIPVLDPSLTIPETIAGQIEIISDACRKADAAIRRPRFGMEIRTLSTDLIYLDLNYTGQLNHHPWRRWNNTPPFLDGGKVQNLPPGTGLVIVPGTFSVQQVILNDFDVYPPAGIIQYHRLRLGGNFPRTTDPYQGWWGETLAAYHAGAETQVDVNELPYRLTASYTAGYFTIIPITAAPSGGSTVTIQDVTNVGLNDEFYFSSDPINEPVVDTRIVTAVDTLNNIVTFTPALGYNVPVGSTFRKVDKNVRTAIKFIISDILRFPPNTKTFRKGLGRNAIAKQWERRSSDTIPGEAMELLSDYQW